MTIIVGLEHEGTVYIGGDAAASDNYIVNTIQAPKVFAVGDALIGFTDSFRMGQVLQYNTEFPEHPDGMDDMRYLSTIWMDTVRQSFADAGFTYVENEQESGGAFLLGYRGCLYFVDADFGITRANSGFNATGSGYALALGSLYTTDTLVNDGINISPEHRLVLAMSSATLTPYVRPPFTIMAVKYQSSGAVT